MTLTDGIGARQTVPPRVAADAPTRTLAPPPTAPSLKVRRRPALLALGVCLAAVGILAGAWIVNTSGQREAVLVVAHEVPYGGVLNSADLTIAHISTDSGVSGIAAAHLDDVIGRAAATDLLPGSLLTADQVTDAAPPGVGQVLVALALPPSRLPASGLHAGDHVLVVDTPAPGDNPPQLPPATTAATVVRIGAPDDSGTIVIDVTVAAANGPALAARSATGRIALVLQPRGR